jgi:hypothetical protein
MRRRLLQARDLSERVSTRLSDRHPALATALRLVLAALAITAPLLLAKPNAAEAARVRRDAVLTEIVRTGPRPVLTLDYVEIRECDCDGGFEIRNDNPQLRTFALASSARILLLRNASGTTFRATVQQLVDARKGRDFGWYFDKDTPLRFTVDEGTRVITEIRQIYFP